MLFRRKIWPKTIYDGLVTTFLFFIIPIVYYFELFIVVAKFYPTWTGTTLFHYVCGTFMMFNICSNLVAVVVCDTSIKGRFIPANLDPNWRFCAVCESTAPPRSWHCNICDVCILKRDHHCIFTSCCIGYYNHRYFLMFLFYMFAATLYASFYNVHFILELIDFWTWENIFKAIFPLAFLVVNFTQKQLYLFLVLIVLIGCLDTGVLLFYHLNVVWKGMVTYERRHKIRDYDLGVKRNLVEVFGDRWFLVWICPFIQSNLPHDGIYWESNKSK